MFRFQSLGFGAVNREPIPARRKALLEYRVTLARASRVTH